METSSKSTPWWVKPAPTREITSNPVIPKLELDISSSLADFLEKEKNLLSSGRDDGSEVDVGSIIEEINRVAAQSPLGPYDTSTEGRSIEDIMREAERIYIESSKSFEQLSQRSKTSQNVTDLNSHTSKDSTPTPKSVSPLPLDDSDSETYSEDFSAEVSKVESVNSPVSAPQEGFTNTEIPNEIFVSEPIVETVINNSPIRQLSNSVHIETSVKDTIREKNLIGTLASDNNQLRDDMQIIKVELYQTKNLLEQTKTALTAQSLRSPEINLDLQKALEDLKDHKETQTALQLQLDAVTKTHALLKNSYEDLLGTNKNLECRVTELDSSLAKYKTDVVELQTSNSKLQDNERHLNKIVEIEKLQSKSLKLQNEKDAKCILDLNRQIKEMERIIARKHPDSVSALIVAAKNDASDTNLSARRILEDRIKSLEEEATSRDSQSSRIFLDIQEKFNQMKLKYESHIEDLELHVNDLKDQLKRKVDTFDIYTQTQNFEYRIPQKDNATISTQTDRKRNETVKEDAHLLATIRGLQVDLSNKEKVVAKLQRDIDDAKKTNKKILKEKEGSLKSIHERREFRSYPEKLSLQMKSPVQEEDTVKVLKNEKEKLKQQMCRIEEDYQTLKAKRLHDLNALQEAHEHEIATYSSNITPLREQLELQQVSLSTLQNQLSAAREELVIVTVERDHLNAQLAQGTSSSVSTEAVDSLQKKVSFLEKRYEEREFRLRAIVHGLAQKNVTNRSCEQCAERQQQLIGYKVELDQLLATLRALK